MAKRFDFKSLGSTRNILCALAALFIHADAADRSFAQTKPASASRLTLQSDVDRGTALFHKDPFNKPCLTFEAIARAHITNSNIFDHIVSVNNHCRQVIKLRLCYRKSEHCIDVQVPGGQRKDVVLGVFPALKTFQYECKETF
jgi:hypothetical protein